MGAGGACALVRAMAVQLMAALHNPCCACSDPPPFECSSAERTQAQRGHEACAMSGARGGTGGGADLGHGECAPRWCGTVLRPSVYRCVRCRGVMQCCEGTLHATCRAATAWTAAGKVNQMDSWAAHEVHVWRIKLKLCPLADKDALAHALQALVLDEIPHLQPRCSLSMRRSEARGNVQT